MPAAKNNQYALGNKGGRPTMYKDEYAEQAYKLCLLGHTDAELAMFFGVNEDTVNEWKKAHEEFSESVTRGKVIADANVAEGLYKRATGYTYNEVTFEKIDGQVELTITPDEMITTDAYRKKIVTKHLAPDPGAALNWLKNRQKAKWRDAVDVNLNDQKGASLKKWTADDVAQYEAWQNQQNNNGVTDVSN